MLCVVYNLYCLRLFLLVHYIGYIARMSDLLGIIDILDDDSDLHLDELSAASVSAADNVASLLPSQMGFLSQVCFFICLFINISFYFLADTFVSFYLEGYSFGTFDLGIIVSKMRQYISSHSGFRFVMRNHYFGVSGRSDVPGVLASSCLNTTYF